MKTYKFKLYNSKRNKKLHRQINIAGSIYNHCIALHRRYYRIFKKSLGGFSLSKHLTKLKKITRYSHWKLVGAQAIQDITDRISRGYALFFRNLKHNIKTAPPCFKKIRKYKSFTWKQTGYKYTGQDNSIIIQKQKYRFFKSREIEGKICTVTVKRDSLGDIYIYFVCKNDENKVLARTGKSVGFDFGLKTFLTSSDGMDIESPLFFMRNSNAIANANRRISRKKQGSANRKRMKVDLYRLYKKTANQRNDFHWKLANRLCGEYPVICVENLNLRGMHKQYGRKISDLGFAEFLQKLEYVAHRTGTTIIKVDRFFPSSQLCSCCGQQNHQMKDLRIRKWQCSCGAVHQRDRNAAINILNEGLKYL